jgi:hypothetical protein
MGIGNVVWTSLARLRDARHNWRYKQQVREIPLAVCAHGVMMSIAS